MAETPRSREDTAARHEPTGRTAIHRRFASLASTPWTNGNGKTTELVSYRESSAIGPGGSRWRLSVAEIVNGGEFSSLPGIRRVLLPVQNDLTLEVDGRVHEVEARTRVSFDGASRVVLADVSSPCNAVNLMIDGSFTTLDLSVGTVAPPGTLLGVVLDSSGSMRQFDVVTSFRAAETSADIAWLTPVLVRSAGPPR